MLRSCLAQVKFSRLVPNRGMTSEAFPQNIPANTLWEGVDLPNEPLNRLKLSQEPDPSIDSSFKLGTAAQTSIGLSGLAAAYFHELRTGTKQTVSVDSRHAVLEFRSEAWYTIDGKLPGSGSLFDELSGLYKTKDNSYVRTHTNFPHHRQGVLDILQCEPTKSSVAEAILSNWNAIDLETEASERKMVVTALRSFDEWDRHPQGRALAGVPPVVLKKIGNAPKREVTRGGNPRHALDGIRVLDLTRVLAGPVCGRTLAAHGADVLLVTSPKLPALPMVDVETSRGKRTTQLDLTQDSDHDRLTSLVQEADVFLQAYRPGGLTDKTFGPEEVAKSRPGIVYASLTAYGWEGPWKDRRGFDSLVQTATGFNVAEAQAYAEFTGQSSSEPLQPKALPMQAIDHAAGYLLAFGINAALCKTISEGGSWEVRVSLAAVGQWIRSLGRIDPAIAFGKGKPFPARTMPQAPEIAALAISVPCSAGEAPEDPTDQLPNTTLGAIKHAAILSETPVREGEAPMILNRHSATWLPRSSDRSS